MPPAAPAPSSPPSPPPPTSALRRFLALEAAGGIVLVACAVVAVAWASSPWDGAYHRVFSKDLRHVVNDQLMAIFFLVVGLEIKRELTTGELRDRRVAALPAFAALGGMLVPAGIYTAFNAGGAGAAGWGIPTATDIAFAVGVLSLVGSRAPASLRLFLLSLAVIDDIGAIIVIAVFYAGGIHLTLAGVALGLALPAGSLAERAERLLHPVSTFLVVPLFALANAGIRLDGGWPSEAGAAAVAAGVIAGLCAGKVLGVTAGALLAVRTGVASLPTGVGWTHVAGAGALAGIGFTVSLFITGLAFDPGPLSDAARLGVLVASVASSAIGIAILLAAHRRSAAHQRS